MARPKPSVLPEPVWAETRQVATFELGIEHRLLHGGQGGVATVVKGVAEGFFHGLGLSWEAFGRGMGRGRRLSLEHAGRDV